MWCPLELIEAKAVPAGAIEAKAQPID